MRLRDYAFTEDGAPLTGATVEVYKVGSTLPAAPSVTTDSSGAWEFSQLEPGEYDVRITSHDGSIVYHRKGNVAVQVAQLVGTDGVSAPLPNRSVSAAQLKDGAVGESVVLMDTESSLAANQGPLRQLIGVLSRVVRQITGKASWWTEPAISLEELNRHAHRHAKDGVDPITPEMIGALPETYVPPEGGGGGAPLGHKHPGSDITSAVATANNALALNGLGFRDFLQYYGGATDGSTAGWFTSGGVKVMIGSNAGYTDNSGRLRCNFPSTFPGNVLWVMCISGSSDYRGAVTPVAGSSDRNGFTAQAAADGSRLMRVNWMAVGY